jgi:hypothetical protein
MMYHTHTDPSRVIAEHQWRVRRTGPAYMRGRPTWQWRVALGRSRHAADAA